MQSQQRPSWNKPDAVLLQTVATSTMIAQQDRKQTSASKPVAL
jgi:hypothetical protein